jgi:hypothetical protein
MQQKNGEKNGENSHNDEGLAAQITDNVVQIRLTLVPFHGREGLQALDEDFHRVSRGQINR